MSYLWNGEAREESDKIFAYERHVSPTEIHADMKNTLGDDCHSYSSIKNQAAEFKPGRTSIKDEPWSDHPWDVTADSQVDIV